MLLRLINPPAPVSISAGQKAAPWGRVLCRDRMLRSHPALSKLPRMLAWRQCCGCWELLGSALSSEAVVSFLFLPFNFLELFVLGSGQLLSVIAEPGIQRQA